MVLNASRLKYVKTQYIRIATEYTFVTNKMLEQLESFKKEKEMDDYKREKEIELIHQTHKYKILEYEKESTIKESKEMRNLAHQR